MIHGRKARLLLLLTSSSNIGRTFLLAGSSRRHPAGQTVDDTFERGNPTVRHTKPEPQPETFSGRGRTSNPALSSHRRLGGREKPAVSTGGKVTEPPRWTLGSSPRAAGGGKRSCNIWPVLGSTASHTLLHLFDSFGIGIVERSAAGNRHADAVRAYVADEPIALQHPESSD